MGVIGSKSQKNVPFCLLTLLPPVLLDNIWTFIPFCYITSRCLSHFFTKRHPSLCIKSAIWQTIQTMALANFDRPEVQTMLMTNIDNLIFEKTSYADCITYFASRIGAAFMMQYHRTVDKCLEQHINNDSLFQLFCLPLSHCWQIPNNITVPILSKKQHENLVTIIRKRNVELRRLTFTPQIITTDVLKIWAQNISPWNLDMVGCNLNSAHMIILLKMIDPFHVRSMNLSKNKFNDDCVNILVEYIKVHKHTCLILRDNLFSPNGQAEILQATNATSTFFSELNIQLY